jgi:hypothetical protein
MKVVKPQKNAVYSIGILWNAAESVSKDIMKQIADEEYIIQIRRYEMGEDYFDFVKRCYQRDDSQQFELNEYINRKISRMEETEERNIVVFVAKIENPQYRFDESKNKHLCEQVIDVKKRIREKYSSEIDRYCYDVLLHMSDSVEETEKLIGILSGYDDKVVESFLRKGCEPYITPPKEDVRKTTWYSEILNNMKSRGNKRKKETSEASRE